jgi:hypothetical protein
LHTSVNVNSVKAKLLTTVRASTKARSAGAAIDVGIDGTLVADLNAVSIVRNLDDLSREFMS